jgi:hypothetical protein
MDVIERSEASMAHQRNRHSAANRRGLVLALVFAGALMTIVTGVHCAAQMAVEVRQQLESTIPGWIPRLVLETAVLAISRMS